MNSISSDKFKYFFYSYLKVQVVSYDNNYEFNTNVDHFRHFIFQSHFDEADLGGVESATINLSKPHNYNFQLFYISPPYHNPPLFPHCFIHIL